MKTKRFIRIIAFLLIIIVVCHIASAITMRKDSERKYADYKQNAENVDVLFFGSSHILNAVNPAQIYGETGITSYNMGKPGGILPEAYWTYKLACQYGSPKCVVIDLWSLERDYKFVDKMDGNRDDEDIRGSISLLHTNMDFWPLSKTKFEAVCDLLSSFDTRAEFLFPFSLYHSRWSSLKQDDFVLDNSKSSSNQYLLGCEFRSEIFLNDNRYQPDDKNAVFETETMSAKYLRKLIDECQASGVEVILTFLPMGHSSTQDFQSANYGKEIADEYGLEYINLLDQDTQSLIDYDTDMSDESHVNEFGMYKISRYLGQILSEREYLPDHRGQEGYEFFESAYNSWKSSVEYRLAEKDNLYLALGHADMLNENIAIFIKYDSAALKDKYILNQICKISGTENVLAAKDLNGPYFILKEDIDNSGNMRIYERCGENTESDIPTLLGSGEYIGLTNFAAFYYNGDYDHSLFDMEEHYHSDIQMFILNSDGTVKSAKYYSCNW